MGNDKYDFYLESTKKEESNYSTLIQYSKLAIPYTLIVCVLVLAVMTREDNTNTARVGNVRDVGGNIVIYNTDGKHIPKGHMNISKYNKEEEAKFLNYLSNMDSTHTNFKLILTSLNDRLVTIHEEAHYLDARLNEESKCTHITFWYKECGEGYHALNGELIGYTDIEESLGSKRYPDLTKILSDENIIPCIYIGK